MFPVKDELGPESTRVLLAIRRRQLTHESWSRAGADEQRLADGLTVAGLATVVGPGFGLTF